MDSNEVLDELFHEEDVKLVQATLTKRFINSLIDGIFVGMTSYLVLDLFGSDMTSLGIFNIPMILLTVGYYFLMETVANGKTIGKFVTKTKVVTVDGRKPKPETILGRSFVRQVPFEAFSFLGEAPNGWHDRWTKTIVIDEDLSHMPKSGDNFINRY